MTAVASADIMFQVLNLFEKSEFGKVCQNCLSCVSSSHACIFSAVENFGFIFTCTTAFNQCLICLNIFFACHIAVISETSHHRQVMTQTNFKVIRVMCRGDFNNTCTFFHIGMFIAYNGDFFIYQRQNCMTAVKMFISFIFGIDSNSGITKHGFGTSCSDFKKLACFLYFIEDMPEMTVLLFIFNLSV